MSTQIKPQQYRDAIDELVRVCREGQGQVAVNRVRAGLWNENATKDSIPDQYENNQFLARLSSSDRETLARMLVQQVELGVFEALKVLEKFSIAPFDDGYEGSAYNDFIGRLGHWEWPES